MTKSSSVLANWGECKGERLLGGGSNPFEETELGEMLAEMIETSDAELAETIAALLQEMMGE